MTGLDHEDKSRVPGPGGARDWFDALRLRQWHKNLLVFVPLVFAFRLFDAILAARTAVLFGLFCLASSAVYLVNDVHDREADRRHPLKRLRPLAAGRLGPGAALAVASLLALVALGASNLFLPAAATGVLSSYLVLQAFYNVALRDSAGADVIVIALGFVLRAVAGALAIGVPFSEWLIVCTFFGAVRLALGKRQAELQAGRTGLRKGWEDSEPADLRGLGILTSAVLVVSYTYYCFASRTAAILGQAPAGWTSFPPLLLTLPVVVFGVFRYELLAGRGGAGEPEAILVRDRGLALAVVGWLAVSVAALYAARLAHS